MTTAGDGIGRGLRGPRLRAALAVGLAAVAGDLGLVRLGRFPENPEGRWALALVASGALVALAGGDLATVGLVAPAGGWRRWARISAAIALAAGACLAVAAAALLAAGWMPTIVVVEPAGLGTRFVHMCILAPLLEEATYRLVLAAPLAAAAGAWPAVAASGAAFALLHVAYGNASPENALGGFFLAWAYLRSGSVAVPVALHSGGNALVLLGQLAAWHWLGPAGR